MLTLPLFVAWIRLPVTEILPRLGFLIGLGPMLTLPPLVALTGSPLWVAVGAMELFTIILFPPVPPKFTSAPLTSSTLPAPATLIKGPLNTLILLPLDRLNRSPRVISWLPEVRLMSAPLWTLINPLSKAMTGPT